MKSSSIVILTLILISSCTLLEQEDDVTGMVVSVGEKDLTQDELSEVIPNNASMEDSASIAKSYIDTWIKEQVVLLSAENHLTEKQKSFDSELENYRNSLMTYAYEKTFIKQKLDTMVSNFQLTNYYNNNVSAFVLKDYVLKANYFILPDSLVDLEKFESLFYKKDLEKSTELEQYCVINNAKYYFGEEEWITWSEIKEKIPLGVANTGDFLKKNKNWKFQKDGKLFFLKIMDYNLKGENSPLSLQRNKIIDIIINKRKTELLNKMREDLYLQAKDKNLIKEYE